MTPFDSDTCALVERWSAVEAAGPDAGKFLNNFCTNDILALTEGESCEAMFTDVKAHVLAYAQVGRVAGEGYLALLSSANAERLFQHLDRYLIRKAVDLSIVEPSTWTIGHGEATGGAVAIAALGEGVVAQRGNNAYSRVLLSATELERFRIRLGLPWDGVDVDHRNLPQEVDRTERAISFRKGCYLGQEPVARIDALGRVNWLLRCIESDGPPPAAGAELFADDKAVGRVTSSAADGSQSIALAYVRREHAAEGTRLTLGDREATVRTPLGAA